MSGAAKLIIDSSTAAILPQKFPKVDLPGLWQNPLKEDTKHIRKHSHACVTSSQLP